MKKKYYKLDGSVEEVDVDNTQPSSQRITYDSNNQRQVSRIEPQQTALVKGSNFFDDGYQFGDVAKTIGSTIGDIGTNVAKGFLGHVEGVTDWAQERAADIMDKTGGVYIPGIGKVGIQGAPDWLRQNARFNSTGALFGTNENPMQNIPTYDVGAKLHEGSVAGDVTNQLASGIGQIGAAAGMSYLGGGLVGQGTKAAVGLNAGATYASAKGNAFNRYLESGMSEEEANARSNIDGIAEAVSEQVFAGLPIKNTAGWGDVLSDKIADKVGQKIGSATAGKVFRVLLDGVGEGSEEVISGLIKTIGDDLVVDKKNGQATLNDVFDLLSNPDTWSEAAMAGVTSVLLGTANMGLDTHTRNQILQEYAKSREIPLTQAKQIFNQTADIYGQVSGEPNSYLQREQSEQEILNQPEAMDRLADRVRNQSQPIQQTQQVQQTQQEVQPIEQETGTLEDDILDNMKREDGTPLEKGLLNTMSGEPPKAQETPDLEQTNVQQANTQVDENEQNKGTSESLNESIKEPVIKSNGKNIKLKKEKNGNYKADEDINENITQEVNGNKVSNFYSNITEKAKFITEENREKLSKEDIKYYEGITNKETLDNAMNSLDENPEKEIGNFLSKNPKKADANDVAKGWILLARYQKAGNYQGMVDVAKKMREIGTSSGQTVQAFNILNRLTPEGMIYYAQSELSEAQKEYNKGKSKKQRNATLDNFTLTPEETQFINDTMKKVEGMEDGREKNIEIAKINKMLTDKLPHNKGDSLKGWMRISMLLNPKTQVRNVVGNALIQPVNAIGDVAGSILDRQISKKTGVRTLGAPSVQSLSAAAKGFKRGAVEATQDFRMGLDTEGVQEGKFDIGTAKPFNEKHEKFKVLDNVGKGLNKTNDLLSYVMDAGDRVFKDAIYDSSIKNQQRINKTNEITQEMRDIAEQEALSRTWNDNNAYTSFVLDIRRALNKAHYGKYGLGDVLIPFAKTPANLTKAIVDYSPAGFINVYNNSKQLKNALENNEFNPQMQHELSQNFGKATAGTLLYVLGTALAKAKISTGAADDDKDVKDFMRNTMGVQPYSINFDIDGKKYSFTYDWAQPIAAPLAITANVVQQMEKDKETDSLKRMEKAITNSMNSAFSTLEEQSFLTGIQTVLNNDNGLLAGILEEVEELPARAVPTFLKQIADMTDRTQRQTFENQNPIQTAINSAKAKIPGLSSTLAPRVDTLGNEIEKYGGDKNDITYALKVFLSPSNVSNGKTSKVADEIYKVYESTEDKTVMPKVAPYTINKKGLSAKEREEYQKTSGKIVQSALSDLLNDPKYKSLSKENKASVINGLVNFASNKAQRDFTGKAVSNTYKVADKIYKSQGTTALADYYLEKALKKEEK